MPTDAHGYMLALSGPQLEGVPNTSYRIIKFALANKIFLSIVSKVKMEKSKHAPNTTKFELDQPSRALLKDFGDHQEHETRYTISVSDSVFWEFATHTQLANILCFADMGWLE